MEENNLFDFDSSAVFDNLEPTYESNNYYNPQPEKSKNGTYTAVIRIVPNIVSFKDTVKARHYHWLEDGAGGFKVHTPCIPDQRCPVSDLFFSIKKANEKDPRLHALRYQQYYAAMIQIVNDTVFPENNGKYFLYRIPVKVYQLIKAAAKLTPEQLAIGEKPKDAMNPYAAGYNIVLQVTKGTDGRNYDATKLADSPSALQVDHVDATGNTVRVAIDTLPAATQKTVLESIYTELNFEKECEYIPSDDATLIRVKAFLIKHGASVEIMPSVPYLAPSAGAAPAPAPAPNPAPSQSTMPAENAASVGAPAPQVNETTAENEAPTFDAAAIASATEVDPVQAAIDAAINGAS